MNAATSEEQRFGHYVLLAPLSGGAIATPYIAYDLQASRIVVIKRLKKDKAETISAERFHDEILISTSLSHRNLVHTIQAGTVEGEAYLALEWIQGQNLIKLDERSRKYDPITPPTMGAIVAAVCDALTHATHQFPTFVHRDIAPGNILVGYDGITRLIDYGFAISPLKATKTNAGDVPGTPGFVAPERRFGKEADLRSDLYSLASVAVFLMTGIAPRIDRDITDHPTILLRAAQLVPFFRRALANNPDERYQTIAEFKAALCEAIAEPLTSEEALGEFVSSLFANHKANAAENAEAWHRRFGRKGAPQRTQQLNLSPDGKPIAGPRSVTLPGNGPGPTPLAPPPEPESSRQPTLLTAPVTKAAQHSTLVLEAGPADRRRRAIIIGTAAVAAIVLAVAAVVWLTAKPSRETQSAPVQPTINAPPPPPAKPPAPPPPLSRSTPMTTQKREPARTTTASTKACAHLARADEALIVGDYDQAAKLIGECLKSDPGNSKARKLIELIPTTRRPR